jgi:hypothetical protein
MGKISLSGAKICMGEKLTFGFYLMTNLLKGCSYTFSLPHVFVA